MKYTLMHKKIATAEIELDDTTGSIRKIRSVYEPEHLPVGINVKAGIADLRALNNWWICRSIPASRESIREALETLNITSTTVLPAKSYGLSLSDQYWICPAGSGITWDSVNYFDNDFSDDIGDVLFGADKNADMLNFSSPDNTSDGNLKKRWKIIHGKRCLVKGGSGPFRQQPFNEVIAAGIMKRLGISHVPYTLTWNGGLPYSICEDFVDHNTDLISAYRIYGLQKKPNNLSVYHHFVNMCERLGIHDAISFLDRMIITDYIIANEDRHMNNFGLLRSAETQNWIGFAPIYDSGSSLGYDKLPRQIRAEKDIICKPFKNNHMEQLKLVSDFSLINFDALSDVTELITEVFSAKDAQEYTDDERINAIADSVRHRIRNLREMTVRMIARGNNKL